MNIEKVVMVLDNCDYGGYAYYPNGDVKSIIVQEDLDEARNFADCQCYKYEEHVYSYDFFHDFFFEVDECRHYNCSNIVSEMDKALIAHLKYLEQEEELEREETENAIIGFILGMSISDVEEIKKEMQDDSIERDRLMQEGLI